MGAREWKDLKAKQKQKLSEVMFGVVCAHYKEHGQMPAGAELEKLAKAAFTKIQGRGLGLSYETVHDVFLKNRPDLRSGSRRTASRSRRSPG